MRNEDYNVREGGGSRGNLLEGDPDSFRYDNDTVRSVMT